MSNHKLDKSCVQHDMACKEFKDLPGRATADRLLRYKAYNIAKILKLDGNQKGLAAMPYNLQCKT